MLTKGQARQVRKNQESVRRMLKNKKGIQLTYLNPLTGQREEFRISPTEARQALEICRP